MNFKIGSGVVELYSKLLPNERPKKVEGIKVGKSCAKLHILHATEYGNAAEGDSIFVKDGTKIAEYVVHYEDGKTETIPVVYGEDVRDWWFNENAKGVSRGKVAWTGDNDAATGLQCRIRLYLTTGVWSLLAAAVLIAAVSGAGLWRASQPVDHPLVWLNTDLGPDAVVRRDLTAAISPDGT